MKFNKPLPDQANVRATEAKIHAWLNKNRKGYNADRWAYLIENYSNPGEFTIPLPPEADRILTPEEKTGIIEDLPESWFPPIEEL